MKTIKLLQTLFPVILMPARWHNLGSLGYPLWETATHTITFLEASQWIKVSHYPGVGTVSEPSWKTSFAGGLFPEVVEIAGVIHDKIDIFTGEHLMHDSRNKGDLSFFYPAVSSGVIICFLHLFFFRILGVC